MLAPFKLAFTLWLLFCTSALAQNSTTNKATSSASKANSNPQAQAKQIWQLLDYIAIDYAGAVADGKVIQAAEYAEMQEFSTNVEHLLQTLSGSQAQVLITQATVLSQAVSTKAPPATVAQLSRRLAGDLQRAYPFPQAPSSVPDVVKGQSLFQANCAACHGNLGKADGPLAATLEPKPTDFTDLTRARERSPFALYQVISQGVSGTAMKSFASISDADRWALALFVGTLSAQPESVSAGHQLWQKQETVRQALPNLEAFAQTSEQALTEKLGTEPAHSVMAYLRTDPAALVTGQPTGTALARLKLADSVTALQQGNRGLASQLALSAYLDGFEPIEPALATRNRDLFLEIETAMMAYRGQVAQGSLSAVETAQTKLNTLLDQADAALEASRNDASAAFMGAFTILVREGLEALLVVVGMLAFLRKANRSDVIKYVHAGWISALAAGGLTWVAATYLISISGASRELTEGISALFAAIVLLAVGMWMHQKSVAGRWQIYLKEKLSSALSQRTAWFLFTLAFVAVYREVFETVLFYAALWREGNENALMAGLGAGIALLVVLAFLLLRTSTKIPIGQFFRISSILVAVLAVILAGKGVAALQEAGVIATSQLPLPRFELLGIYPSWQTLAVQLAMLTAVIVAFAFNLRPASRTPKA